MDGRADLISVLTEARRLLAQPDNEFMWSGWDDQAEALAEIDALLSQIRDVGLCDAPALTRLFLPTGAIQEVAESSGWGDAFLALATCFDAAMAELGGPA